MGIKAVKDLINAASGAPPVVGPVARHLDAGVPTPVMEGQLQGPTGAYIQSQGSPVQSAGLPVEILKAMLEASGKKAPMPLSRSSALSGLNDSAVPLRQAGGSTGLEGYIAEDMVSRNPRQPRTPEPISTPELIKFIKGNQAPQFDAARKYIADYEPEPPAAPAMTVEPEGAMSDGTNLSALPTQFTLGIRKHITNPDGSKTRVSGASMDAVGDMTRQVQERFDIAARSTGKSSKSSKSFESQYADVIALVNRYGVEAKDGDPTVIAPVVSALSKVEPELRAKILKAAGNPEALAFLNDADFEKMLPRIESATKDIEKLPTSELTPFAPVVVADRKYNEGLSQKNTPYVSKPQSHMVRPDSLQPEALFNKLFEQAGQGVPANADQFREWYASAFSEANAAAFRANVAAFGSPNAKRLLETIDPDNVSGADEALFKLTRLKDDSGKVIPFGTSSSSKEVSERRNPRRSLIKDEITEKGSHLLRRLAGDQKNEATQIEMLGPEGLDLAEDHPELLAVLEKTRKLPIAEQRLTLDALAASGHTGIAGLPPLGGGGLDNPYTLKTGTGARRDDTWGGRGASRGQKIDSVVESRNSTRKKQITDRLYALTRSEFVEDATNPSIPVEYLNTDTTKTVDLDKLAPWVRARYGVAGPDGIQYPDKFLSAKTVTEWLQYSLQNNDPGFVARMTPLIERSIAAMPELPTTPGSLWWSNQTYLPSTRLVKEAADGKTYSIHGIRSAGRGEIVAPQRHGFKPAEGFEVKTQENFDDYDAAQNAKIKELRKNRKPGNTDQSSIYQLSPSTSPLRSLLV